MFKTVPFEKNSSGLNVNFLEATSKDPILLLLSIVRLQVVDGNNRTLNQDRLTIENQKLMDRKMVMASSLKIFDKFVIVIGNPIIAVHQTTLLHSLTLA